MPRRGVKKRIGRGSREQCRSVAQGDVKKKKRSLEDRESGVSLSLDSV